MTTVDVTDVLKRTQGTGNGSLTEFSFSFQVNATNEVKVYEDTTLKTEGTHYDIVDSSGSAGLNANGTGVVKFKTSPDHTPADGKIITIVSLMSLARSSVYTSGGNITAQSLETDLDRIHRILGDFKEAKSRSVIAPEHDATTIDMTLPSKANRLGKVLGFNSSSGNPEAVSQITTASVSSTSNVSAGGSATASVAVSGNSANFTFGIPIGNTGSTGATGPAGSHFGLAMTFNNSTSDADPGNGKIAFNNGTLSSASIAYVDNVDDAGVSIASFVQSWDDATNSTARGYLQITKEGTASTFAIFKVSGSVTDSLGYSKVPLTHVVSNGSFSNSDGVTIAFTQSGTDGSGAMNSFTLTDGSTSQTIEDGNSLTITSGEGIDASVSATDTLTIAGEDASTSNKGVASFHSDNFAVSSGAVTIKDGGVNLTAEVTGTLPLANGGTGATTLAGANIVATNAQNTFTKAQLPSTYTGSGLTLDFDTYQNFIITLSSGSNSLANPSTEASQIGQTGVIIFIQPSSSSAGTVSLGSDYETAESAGLTLSSANNDYDVVPYFIKADNSILLGTPQLNFG